MCEKQSNSQVSGQRNNKIPSKRPYSTRGLTPQMYMVEKPSTNLGTSRSKILIFIFGNWRPKFIVTGSTFGLENVLSTSISSKTQEKEWKQPQKSTTNTTYFRKSDDFSYKNNINKISTGSES